MNYENWLLLILVAVCAVVIVFLLENRMAYLEDRIAELEKKVR